MDNYGLYTLAQESATLIYYTSLLACIPIGSLYKKIEDGDTKRIIGAGIGALITICICGPYVYYTLFMVMGNLIIIKLSNRRFVHQISLLFTWLCLLYVHFNVDCTQYATWLFQNLALKLVGLAFELYIYENNRRTKDGIKLLIPPDESITQLSTLDIAGYAYFFIGLHKGPYFTWRTYNDHFNSSVHVQGAEFFQVTEHKLKKAFLLALGYFALRSMYPLSMYHEDDFYTNYGTDYRFLIGMPQLVIYFFEYQIILMLSTSACTEAGFGVYPSKCLAVPGAGPTVAYKPIEHKKGDAGESEEYNFSMLKCFNTEKLLMGPKMKDTVRAWDMSTRYWFSQYIVKNLINNNFEVRSACSFLFWTIWVGPSVQNIIISLTLWVYIHLESDYTYLYADTLSGPSDLGFAIMRMLCLFYLTPCYIIQEKEVALRYYNSIYWMYHIVLAVLAFLAIAINSYRRRAGPGDNKLDPLRKMINELRRTSNVSLAPTAGKPADSDEKTEPKAPEKPTSTTKEGEPTTSGNTANTNGNVKKD